MRIGAIKTATEKGILEMGVKSNYRVFYAKNPTFRPNPDLTPEMIGMDYVHVRDVEADSLGEVFQMMQGEVWSPNGEARDLIRSKGLHHTSMSVGDLIYSPEEDRYFEVLPIGYKELFEEERSLCLEFAR